MDLGTIFTASVFASAIRLATPYIFAALGETFAQRSGVLNLGVDGMMLMGAFSGFYIVHVTQVAGSVSEPMSLLLGVIIALIVGSLDGLGNGIHQRDAESETGYQRHWHLSFWAGI